jgi:acetyl-CoA carboxylase biotin carboxyl carrier protein
MDLAYLKKLVRIIEQSGVDEIEVEEEGLRIRVAKHGSAVMAHAGNGTIPAGVTLVPQAAGGGSPQAGPVPSAPPAPAIPEVKYHEIKSPIVGTFYRAPAPDADPYIEIGHTVQPKTILCIIEAMKLMNEIESDVAGRIVKIMVENGQPVEYNQTLFLLEPA